MTWHDAAPSLDANGRRYLDLLRRALTRELFLDQEVRRVDPFRWPRSLRQCEDTLASRGWHIAEPSADPTERTEGRDWPPTAETMVGAARLENVLTSVCTVIEEGIDGDLVEAGVWRGGVTVLMRGILQAYGITDRNVWVVDSFAGLPAPDPERFPADTADWSEVADLAVGVDAVQANFCRYDLLDDQVRFVEGYFEDTLPTVPIDDIAVLRLDADLYQSTYEALRFLEPRVRSQGFVIIDDYLGWHQCRRAVTDYREQQGITAEIEIIDWTGAFWRTS